MRGLDLIREHEGLRLRAYPDPATGGKPWTIGYGRAHGVQPGDEITLEQAEQFLAEDVATCQDTIRQCVKVPLTDGQLWALTSFAFNCGVNALRGSTLLRLLNEGNYAAAADQFPRWIRAAGKVLPGLRRRREAERALFLGIDAAPPAAPAPSEPIVVIEPAPARPAPPPPEHNAMPIPAILAALLPTLASAIPEIVKLIKPDSDAANKNAEVAGKVFEVAQKAINAANAQDVVEQVTASPAAAQAVSQAIRENWFALEEVGGGIQAAREADRMFSADPVARVWRSPSFLAMLVMTPMVYMIVGSVAGLWGYNGWSDEVRTAIGTTVISLIVGGAAGYYWGSTTSRNKPAQA